MRKGYWTGKHRSEETKDKLRDFRTGKKASQETKEKMSLARKGKAPFSGRTHSEETKKKISDKLKGNKSHTWKGGVTPEYETIRHSIESKIWRLSVYERDNFTCQKCGQKGGNLNCHHIVNFSSNKKLRFDIENGVTLCKECHGLLHKKYTKLNNTREQLNEYLK
jgi:hypothetical protein